ncbi:MAG: EAL domain-containing protein [Gammaproteobacteria bacterium]|nr:MAG: EAL domain-containing protein [Gammaproteobacteria bacterium]
MTPSHATAGGRHRALRLHLLGAFLGVALLALTAYALITFWMLRPAVEARLLGLLQARLLVAGLAVLLVAAGVALWISHRLARRLERQQAALRHQALHDQLTGLPNRALFADRLETALRQARRQGTQVALLVIDLDRFKEINDTLGHAYGDALLREVGRRLRNVLRASDTVARLGGDEFAIVLPEATPETAHRCARRILDACDTPVQVERLHLKVRPSIGIAFHPEHGSSGDALLRHADVAMYQAKREGTGLAVYKQDADPHNLRRLTLLNDLASAAHRGQLRLLYQPQLELRTGRVIGVEALVRWVHPRLGLVPAREFIELAEHHGLIGQVTTWVLEEAIRQAARWRREGLELCVTVNLSAHDLQDRRLPERLRRLLDKYDLPADRLELEVTESAVMRDFERGLAVCHRIAGLGIRLAIDDFGSGMSSLRYLRQLPAEILKIDRGFVMDMAEDENNAVIVRSIVDLSHHIGRRVVAEGVQDADALLVLQVLGCDLAQGFYISPPCPAEELHRWLRDFEQRARLHLA